MYMRPTHIISYWVIPGGYDYTAAFLEETPAFSFEEAEQITRELGEGPPAMAIILTLAEWYAGRKRRRNKSRVNY